MKKNLYEEIERINQLMSENLSDFKTTMKVGAIQFAKQNQDVFINYFNRIAAQVNTEEFCNDPNKVAQDAIVNLETMITNMTKQTKDGKPETLINSLLNQLNGDTALVNNIISMAGASLKDAENKVPKEILEPVLKHLGTKYGESGKNLVAKIRELIVKLNQEVVEFCGENRYYMGSMGTSSQEPIQTAQSKGVTQSPTNQAKSTTNQTPKTQQPTSDTVKGFQDSAKKMADLKIGGLQGVKSNTLGNYTAKTSQNTGTVAQEKNRPIQNVASKVKDAAGNIVNKVKEKIKNRGGQGPATT